MKKIRVAAVSMLLFGVAGCGSYGEMTSELAAYRPSSYVQSLAGKKKFSEPAQRSTQSSRNEENKQIARMRQRWQNAIDTTGAGHLFYRPDPDRFRRLSAAAKTDKGAAGVLRGGYTLETLEMLILIRNPGIHAAKSRVRAEITAFGQVSDLDSILAQYSAFTEGLMTGVGPMKGQNSIRMEFPFPGVTALKGEVVNASVAAVAAGLAIARRDALTAVRKTYWNLLYVRKSRRITAETLELFRRLASVAGTRYRAGATSYQDVIKVTIESRILAEDLVTLEERTRNMESKLRDILDLPPETALGPPVEQAPERRLPPLDRLYRLARERRQELLRLRAAAAKMAWMLELGETMILPQYTLGFSYYDNAAVSQEGSAVAASPSAAGLPKSSTAGSNVLPQVSLGVPYDGGKTDVPTGSAPAKPPFATRIPASVGAGLPKSPWFGTNDAWLNGTRRSLEAVKADLKKAAAETDNRVRIAWFEMDKAIREAALYRDTVVALSKSALDVSTRGYESGTVSFADVIGSYTNWLDVGLSLARKISDIGVARAELEQAVGASF